MLLPPDLLDRPLHSVHTVRSQRSQRLRDVVIAMLLVIAAPLLVAASGGPAPEGLAEGEIVEIDGVLYQVHGRMLYTLDDPILEDKDQTIAVTDSLVDDSKRKATRTEVIDGASIRENGARTLADVLEEQAGIQINSLFGLSQEVQLDGLDGRHVLVLIDGRPVNGKLNNKVDVSRLPIDPATIERIEVVRGPMSALYGSEALGGVINIVTKRPTQAFGGEVDLGGQLVPGAWWTQVGLHGRGGSGPIASRLDLTFNDLPSIDRAGYDADANVVSEGPDGKADLADRRQFGMHGEVALPLLDRFSLRTTIDGSGTQQSSRTSPTQAFRDRSSNQDWSAAVNLEADVLDGGELMLDLRVNRYQHIFDKLPAGGDEIAPRFCNPGGMLFDPDCPAPPDLRTDTVLDESRFEMRLKGPLASGFAFAEELTAAGGLVFSRQQTRRVDGEGEDTIANAGGGARGVGSAYGELLWRPFTFLSIIPGARADAFAPSVDGGQLAIGPKISARVDLPARVAVRGSYGRGFRLPTFEEQFLRFDHSELGYVVLGNPDLVAEQSHGFRAEVLWDPFAELSLAVDSYLNLVDDMIVEVPVEQDEETGAFIFQSQNTARAVTSGVNARASVGPLFGVQLDVTYHYLIVANDAGSCPKSNPYFCSEVRGLPLRPAHSLDTNLRYRIEPSGTVLFMRGDFTSERELNALSETGERTFAPAFFIWSAGVRQPFLDHFEAIVGIENILDAYHPTFGPKPGRHLSINLRAFM